MKLLPYLLIALLVAPLVSATTETYSFVKADFDTATFHKLVDLQGVYSQKALKIHLDYSTLVSNGSNFYLNIAFGDSASSPSVLGDCYIIVTLIVGGSGVKEVRLRVSGGDYGNTIAQKKQPETIPTELTIEVEDGRLSCKELGVKDFGVGQFTINAVYGSCDIGGTATNGAWDSGYVTVEINEEVGFTGLWRRISPVMKLYIELAILAMVVGTIVAVFSKALTW